MFLFFCSRQMILLTLSIDWREWQRILTDLFSSIISITTTSIISKWFVGTRTRTNIGYCMVHSKSTWSTRISRIQSIDQQHHFIFDSILDRHSLQSIPKTARSFVFTESNRWTDSSTNLFGLPMASISLVVSQDGSIQDLSWINQYLLVANGKDLNWLYWNCHFCFCAFFFLLSIDLFSDRCDTCDCSRL